MLQYSNLKGYDHRLHNRLVFMTPIRLEKSYIAQFLELHTDGRLVIKPGYCWDGPSGPTWKDKTNMEPSCFHDAMYQLMRLEIIEAGEWREWTDVEFVRQCKKRKMNWLRARIYLWAVREYGEGNSKPETKPRNKIITIP